MSALDIRFAADGGNLRVNAPRGALSEALRQRIADHKQALLDFLHRAAAPEAPRLAPVPRVSDEGAAPLSFAQERLWFLEQLEPGGAVFNLCRALRITGALDAVALEASLNAVLRRQEALRTKFIIDGGRPVQAIAPFRHSRLKFVDLSRSSLQERETARVIDAFVRRPFDLTSGRLLRTQLVRLGATEHLLMLGTHHMVADAWSMGLLASEIWTHYAAFARGETLVLPELPVRYRDYAAWQRQQLQGARFESLLAYWTRRLGNAPPLDLPTDRPRPARPSYRGRHQPIVIAAPLTAALNQLSRSENATLFMTLLAGFQVLLHRYSGQEDIVVGTPAANREQPELESVIGLFVNTLVLRSDFTGAPSFRELLQRVRQTCLDGLARRELPFEKLIEALSPRRELNRHPLFQAMFVLQNTPRPMVAPNGLQIESVEIDNPTAQFDLSLYLRERDGKLIGYFEYASELFDASTIERLAENFTTLLESIVAAPERSVAALELFGAGERRLRTEWNDTAAAYPTDRAIHELFEAQAERTPDAIALEFAGARLTYRDLNRRANRLARHLLRIGVGPEKPVAIMIERSPELVIGLLAILKAGGAFVPLDPHYPEARLRFMIEDSQAAVLLTLERSVEDRGSRKEDGTQIPNSDPLSSILDPRLKVVDLDRDGPEIASQSLHDPKTLTNGDSPAYIIYTSGSTGEPKGVVGLHRGAVNRFNWMWRRYPFGANEVCCAKTSIGFVDAVWEIFGPLLQGVRLVLVPDEVAREPSRLIDFLAEHDITRLVLVPSLLRAMLQESAKLGRRLPKLLLWSCSGEALPAELARRFSNSHPRARLLNIYGSSEVAADVTCFEYRAANVSPLFEKGEQGEILQDRRKKIPLGPPFSKGEARSSVPIGRPIDNTQIYLLDSERQPVPVGVAGELYVGGAGLARGYWRRTELTEESFVANPFSIDGDSRMFRSGDLARYLPDGNLQYLGRLDRQVKVRGQRVELGEIETALRTYPAIGDCVVVASSFRSPAFFPPPRRRRTKVGVMPSTTDVHEQAPPSQPFPVKGEGVSELDRTLTAYVVATGANAPDAGELRQFLRATLPEFMVPAAFVMLDALPLTPSGKVDHKALPAPKVDSSFGLPPSIPPRNELEREIAALWRELLNLKEVGIDDDFFALGGHSLLAASLVAHLSAAFKREISLRDFLTQPTIRALALKIAGEPGRKSGDGWPPIVPLDLNGELPISLAQEQFFKLDELISGAAFLHLPYAYRLNGRLDLAALRRSLQAIVERHAVLRSVFYESRGSYVQRIRSRLRVACPLHDLSRLSPLRQRERLARLSAADAELPFDLSAGAPFRFKLIRLAERRHILLATLHHIVADQTSFRVLRAELAKFYRAFARGRAPALADLPFQFADFTRWQANMLASGKFAKQVQFWRRTLTGRPALLNFQPGVNRPAALSPKVARRSLQVDESLFAKVRALARAYKTTPFIVVLAAVDVWLFRLTGCRDLRIGALVANRERSGTEKLIGYFVNAVVLRARPAPQMSFAELIEQARATALGAFAQQDLPIENLQRALRGKKSAPRTGLYHVLVNYRRFESRPQKAAGLTIASYAGKARAATPDIAFTSADLNVEFQERKRELTLHVNFREQLFESAALDRLIASFASVLDQAVAQPGRPLMGFVDLKSC